jgi:DNA-directed RNA polymerase specialized sigma24 family protein
MSSGQKSLDELLKELPVDSRERVRSFAEYLSKKNQLLNNFQFLADLKTVCQSVTHGWLQSGYYSSEDLQQDVLLRVWQARSKYLGEVPTKASLQALAQNMLDEAVRKEKARHPYDEDIAFDQFMDKTLHRLRRSSSKSTRKLKQSWAGGLSDFREQYTSLELQKKALEWRGD